MSLDFSPVVGAVTQSLTNYGISNGNLASTAIYTTSAAAQHRFSYNLEVATTDPSATVSLTLTWTSRGVAKTFTSGALALAAAANYVSGNVVANCDLNTSLSVSTTVTGSAGSYYVTGSIEVIP